MECSIFSTAPDGDDGEGSSQCAMLTRVVTAQRPWAHDAHLHWTFQMLIVSAADRVEFLLHDGAVVGVATSQSGFVPAYAAVAEPGWHCGVDGALLHLVCVIRRVGWFGAESGDRDRARRAPGRMVALRLAELGIHSGGAELFSCTPKRSRRSTRR